MKINKLMATVCVLLFLCISSVVYAELGDVIAKSDDIEINFFGSLKAYPHFMKDVNFNSNSNSGDFIVDEGGPMANHSMRNEIRLGWAGEGENWDFLVVLEGDFVMNKTNCDRGGSYGGTGFDDKGMTGEDFGVEKLNFSYNLGQATIFTGWDTKFLDIRTGGLLYGDDHPYLGLSGKVNSNFSWEFLYLMIQDETDVPDGDSHAMDWRAYTLKGIYKMDSGIAISPFYAFSDNDEDNAQGAEVSYLGIEAYGKIGILTPRLEFVMSSGDTKRDENGKDYDIMGMAAYASVDIEVSKNFIPYIGATYLSGDDDDTDNDIDAWNGITDIARYTPTFGMENAMIYRGVPILGSQLYTRTFDGLAKGDTPGYGGISNSGEGSSPGQIMYGIGAKGTFSNLKYKTQVMYFQFEEEGALENIEGKSIDKEVGYEFDVNLTYAFNSHFSIGNTFAVFLPGDAIKDIHGSEYDDTAYLNTMELIWTW